MVLGLDGGDGDVVEDRLVAKRTVGQPMVASVAGGVGQFLSQSQAAAPALDEVDATICEGSDDSVGVAARLRRAGMYVAFGIGDGESRVGHGCLLGGSFLQPFLTGAIPPQSTPSNPFFRENP